MSIFDKKILVQNTNFMIENTSLAKYFILCFLWHGEKKDFMYHRH